MTWSLSRSTTIALLLSPFGILLISITRLLIVSNYNTATALTVASSGGYVNTLLGTFIPVVPIFMPYLALLLLFLDRIVLGVLALFAAALTSPTAVTRSKGLILAEKDGHLLSQSNVITVLTVLLFLALLVEFLGVESDESIRTLSTVLGLIFIPFVLVLYPLPIHSSFYGRQLQQPWLPAENITLRSYQNLTGYVLSRDNGWFVILLADNRTIDYVHADQVVSQEICQPVSTRITRPLVTLIKPPAVVPTCPVFVLSGR